MSASAASDVELVYHAVCPFAHRAWLALAESGIAFEAKETSITAGSKPEWFTDVYRKSLGADLTSDGKVPVIVVKGAGADGGDFVLTESAVIVDYVANKYAPQLLPKTPEDRARAAIFTEQVIGKLIRPWYGLLKGQEPEVLAREKAALLAALAEISKAYEARGGPFFFGETISTVDFLVWPWIGRIGALTHWRGFSIPTTAEYAAVNRLNEAIRAREALKPTIKSDAYYADGYKGYAAEKVITA